MRLIKKEITSKKVWDDFVLKNNPGALFQSWDWGEVEKKLGHTIWRWGWFNKNKLTGVAQILKVTARRGTHLHIRHGPVGEVNFSDVRDLAGTEKAWFIRISPQSKENGAYNKGFVSAPIHAMDAEVCWVLDLDKNEDELLAGMRKSTRYEIKHGTATVMRSKDIDKFFYLYDETAKRHQFVEHKGIREEFETLECDLFLASNGKQLTAAAIIVYFGDQAIYHHGASIPNKDSGSYLIQWEAIREAKKRGKKVYNFWGIAPDDSPDHPWRGLTSFKTGFGGRVVRFEHAKDYPISTFYIIPKTIEYIRKRLKGY